MSVETMKDKLKHLGNKTSDDYMADLCANIKAGERCEVEPGEKRGVVNYIPLRTMRYNVVVKRERRERSHKGGEEIISEQSLSRFFRYIKSSWCFFMYRASSIIYRKHISNTV
ncbi:hypothetical protein V6N11_048963 [Hibiscus sabdariffa]|uniref:Uncharacterized protein n=1 Tax=Hibiscus sabdariffa TaxID=183260 RepID=A0ABR2PWT2_9ROSI